MSPLAWFIPTSPIGASISMTDAQVAVGTYNPSSPSTSIGIGKLAIGTNGIYAREFLHCAIKGVDKGQCAVVVNTSTSSQSFPTGNLSTTYTHPLKVGGKGIMLSMGDTGTLIEDTSSGVPSTVNAHGAVVVFKI
jgi:hypothetical protein